MKKFIYAVGIKVVGDPRRDTPDCFCWEENIVAFDEAEGARQEYERRLDYSRECHTCRNVGLYGEHQPCLLLLKYDGDGRWYPMGDNVLCFTYCPPSYLRSINPDEDLPEQEQMEGETTGRHLIIFETHLFPIYVIDCLMVSTERISQEELEAESGETVSRVKYVEI